MCRHRDCEKEGLAARQAGKRKGHRDRRDRYPLRKLHCARRYRCRSHHRVGCANGLCREPIGLRKNGFVRKLAKLSRGKQEPVPSNSKRTIVWSRMELADVRGGSDFVWMPTTWNSAVRSLENALSH